MKHLEKNWKKVFIAFVLLLISTMMVSAQPGGERESPNRKMYGLKERWERMADRLELSQDQKDEIERIHLDTRRSMMLKENAIKEKEAALNTVLIGSNPNEKRAEQIVEEIGALRIELHKDRISTRLAVRSLLNEEQKIKFDQFHNRNSLHGHSRHGQYHGKR